MTLFDTLVPWLMLALLILVITGVWLIDKKLDTPADREHRRKNRREWARQLMETDRNKARSFFESLRRPPRP